MKKSSIMMLTLITALTVTACSSNNGGNNGTAGNNAAGSNAAASSNTNAANKESEQPPAEKVEISISSWGAPDERKVFEAVLDEFQKANPNIKVKFIHIPNDYTTKMNTMIAGNSAPDVIFTSDGDFPRWVKQGAFLDITQYVEASDKLDLNDMWEGGLNRYRYDGKITGTGSYYALPKDIGPTVMYYNKTIFDKLGVPYPSAEKPMNWEQALEMWKKLTVDENGDGKTDIFGAGPIWWEGFVWGNSGAVLSDDRKQFTLNETAAADAMQFIYDLTNTHKVVPDSRALQSMNDGQMFEAGKLATITGGRWMVPTYRKLKFDWDVAPIPSNNGSWTNGWSGSVGLGVNAKSKHPEAAFKLVEFFSGIEGQTKMTELGFQIPNFKSMSDDEVYTQPGQKPEHSEVFIKAGEGQQAGTWTYLPNSKWLDTLNQNLSKFWTGKESAVDFFTKLKPQVEKDLKEGNPELFQ
ncbi:multiple sugar transport system substrate-binding protein [Paenibacillus catalpae]|uniref:Multiple sugar transport system substrate-binding protein n=1 Tax=Paenibacillus catalpae TaxID=1045775 RepID=A0A1I1XG22_9BACL|nr:sugar ABC transporter substrate-binding protein [Paenibacillus catalpae]SFE06315.1 multiple sugar transport system substrate-binding protein [Paenibacillus catalpae]